MTTAEEGGWSIYDHGSSSESFSIYIKEVQREAREVLNNLGRPIIVEDQSPPKQEQEEE